MRAPILTAAALLAAIVSASCAPAFNWREAPIAGTSLAALFPCKPEVASRTVNMGGLDVQLHMYHCETDGVTTAVGHAAVPAPARVGPVLDQWRIATLAGLRPTRSSQTVWTMERATALPQAQSVDAAGTDAKGAPLVLKGAWFARDGEVFAALLYGPAVSPEVAEAFFAGLRFR